MYPLQKLFRHWDVDPEREHVFVKIDVESYECALVPSWKAWFAGLDRKPTLYLSMHENVSPCTEDQYHEIAALARAYKYLSPGLLTEDGSSIRGKTGEFVLSDAFPPMV
jgi:hypothetical protein